MEWYLIRKLFRYLVNGDGLSEFWEGIARRYRDIVKLDDGKIRYIIRAREKMMVPRTLHTPSQYRQGGWNRFIYSHYRLHGEVPTLRRQGRKRTDTTKQEVELILLSYKLYRLGSTYLQGIIYNQHGFNINHNRIHCDMKMYSLSSDAPRRWIRKKWVRYERAYSNSLWHVDWYEMKDPRWRGMQLIVYEDDASRFIVGYGLFKEATSHHAVDVSKEATAMYGKPRSILSDRGVQLYAVESEAREKGLTEFEIFLMRNHIRHVLGRVSHPQTNGKVEKLFDEVGKKIKFFSSIDECVYWYNTIKPHAALDLKTPIDVYYEKMPQTHILADPSILEKEVPS